MRFILIVPDAKGTVPSKTLLSRLEEVGSAEIIQHKGRLADLESLKKDKEDKILAVDPDSFDWDLDAESLKDFSNVKAVMTSSTSYDWIKPQILKQLGIVACNVPGFSVDSVAEYSLAMMIEASRRLPIIIKNKGEINWEDTKPMLLKGKTIGIVGLGRIGKRVAEICQGIGMKVIYWSKNTVDDRFKKVDLTDLFKTADVIMPALVENDQTKRLITKELLDAMKANAILLGIGRVKDLYDEEYVLEKVKKAEIGGYVFEGGNAKVVNTYEGNVWALPSMAWYTQESLDNLMKIWVENMIAFAKGDPRNLVN